MGNKAGLWIDHGKAVIVILTDKGEEIVYVTEGVGKQLRRKGESPMNDSFESQLVPADDRQLRAYNAHLRLYYDAVVMTVGKAESVLVFGPGEAKGELKKRLEKNKLSKRIIKVETTDKMTKPQIIAKIRKHFIK